MSDFEDLFINGLYREFQNKFPKKTGKMIANALNRNRIYHTNTKGTYFKYGNVYAEKNTPYYHILENAQRISYKGWATDKTRGKMMRDTLASSEMPFSESWKEGFYKDGLRTKYGYRSLNRLSTQSARNLDFNTAYYRRELRWTKKERENSVLRYVHDKDGGKRVVKATDKEAYQFNSYVNKHYHYIEKTIEDYARQFAHTYHYKLRIIRRSETFDTFSNDLTSMIKEMANTPLNIKGGK